MREADRQRAIRVKLARMPPARTPDALSTGFAALDAALGGGLPRGYLVEIFGPEGSGKTTLALRMAAAVQAGGGTAAWIDAERAFDPAYAARLGIALERLPVARPESAEKALEMARRLALSHSVDLLVVDSAAALAPELELATAIGESGWGLQSRVLATGLRRLAQAAAKTGACAVFLNQTRARMDESGGAAETSAGGAPLKLYAGVRLVLARSSHGVSFRVLKNKAAAAFGQGELEGPGGTGISEMP